MLIHVDTRTGQANTVAGDAHIVLAVGKDGRLVLQAFCQGRMDAIYFNSGDEVLANMPGLLAELRSQLKSSGST